MAKHPNLERIDFQDISSDNHTLLAQRNISQEQALDYFHAVTPQGEVVKGAGVIVEMWKRLPVFRFVAPFFESGVGSKFLSSAYDFWAPRRIRIVGQLQKTFSFGKGTKR